MITRRATCPNCGQAITRQPDPAAVLAAALPVLEAVESYIEMMDGARVVVDWERYRTMRDAFLAFRAGVEGGAPAGWRVAEDPNPNP